jgi:para-nitrobenzyl esterase
MELRYAFDHLDQEPWAWTPDDRRLADAMARYWTNFAKTGDPNGDGVPRWPQLAPGADQVQVLATEIRSAPIPDLAALQAIDAVCEQVRAPR